MSRNINRDNLIDDLKRKIRDSPNSPLIKQWRQQLASAQRAKNRTNSSNMSGNEGNKPNPSGIGRVLAPHEKALQEKMSMLGSMEEIRANFLKTALYPETHCDRMPDETTLPTVIYRSVRELSITANMDGTANAGRFSIAALPVLGNKNVVPEYQLGVVDNSTGWPQNFSLSSSYLSSNNGDDPRIDPYLELLTNNVSGLLQIQHTANQTLDPTVYEGDLFNPTSIPINTLDAVFSNPGGITGTVGSLSFTINNAHPVLLPAGTYNLNVENIMTPTAITGAGVVLLCIGINKEGTPISAFRVGTGISFGTFGTMNANRLFYESELVSGIQIQLYVNASINFVAQEGVQYVFAMQTTVASTNFNGVRSGYVIIPVEDDTLTKISDSGIIIKMRPIAQSALFTCTLPDINAGGNIVAYSAPAGDIQNYYYNTSSTVGPYQNWEVLARNNKGICTLDGMLKQGAYVFSQPWDKNDVLMRTPTESLSYPYQGVIISGQVNPSVGLTGIVEIGRLRVVTVFEYTTDARIFTPMTCIGSTADLDFVLAYLSQCQHAMENPLHFKQISDFMKKGVKFIGDNIPNMIKGLTIASQFL